MSNQSFDHSSHGASEVKPEHLDEDAVEISWEGIQKASAGGEDVSPTEPVTLPHLFKLVAVCSLILGVLATIASAVAGLLLRWLSPLIVGPPLMAGALFIVSRMTFEINSAWIGWVVTHGIRWTLGIRAAIRLLAAFGVLCGFYVFWGVLSPTAMPWMRALIEAKARGDERLLEEVLAMADERGDLAIAKATGTLSSLKNPKLDALLREKFLEKHGAFLVWALPVSVGVQAAIGSSLLWFSLLGWNAAKRSASFHRGKAAMVADARGHAVYFRSFQSDAAPAFDDGVWSAFLLRSEEENLAEAMPRTTRFFAIGRPGEPLPELGAVRMYFTDEAWMAAATEMMRTAALVLIRPHQTPSLIWELQRIVETVPPNRCAIWIPPSMTAQNWNAFIDVVKGIFPNPLPGFEKLRNFVVFDQYWMPTVFEMVNGSKEMRSFSLYQSPKAGRNLLKAELRGLIMRARAGDRV